MTHLNGSDISNLDTVIYELLKNNFDTVPDILNNRWNYTPEYYDPKEDSKYRHYENVLVDNNICFIKPDWTPNSTINGSKPLQLDSIGHYLVQHKKSIKDFFDEEHNDSYNKVVNINNSGVLIQNSKVNQSSFSDFAKSLPIQDAKIPTTKSDEKGKLLSKILSNNWTITVIGSAIAAITAAYFIFVFKWNH